MKAHAQDRRLPGESDTPRGSGDRQTALVRLRERDDTRARLGAREPQFRFFERHVLFGFACNQIPCAGRTLPCRVLFSSSYLVEP